MKNLKSLNLGKSLNREEMKKVNGGKYMLGCGSACTGNSQCGSGVCAGNVPGCPGDTCL